MPTELDELKLRVSLEDDASSQIAALRGNVERLGQVSQSRLTEHVGAFEKAIGSLSQKALGVGHSFENLSRVFGVMPVGLGLIGYEAGRAREKMEQFTSGMVAMTNAARMSGVNIADFQAVLEAFERAGIPREQAAAQIASFTSAVTKLSIPGSKERQELLNMAGKWAPEMAAFIQRIVDTHDPVDRLNIAIEGLREVRDYELTQTHDEQLAIGKAEAVAAMLGLDTSTLNLREKLERDDVRHAERVQNQSEAQVKYNAALTEQQQVEGRIHDIINSSTMVWETWAIKEMTWIEKFILQRLELYNAFSAGAPALHPYSLQDVGRAVGTEEGPGLSSFLGERFKTMFGAGEHPAPAAGGEGGGGGGEKKTEATQENTKQVQTLTDNIGKLIQRGFGGIFNMPIQAMAKGGVVTKPTLALVGEAGSEAVVGNDGRGSIVSKPTVGVLGATGKQIVVPLSGASAVSGGAVPNQFAGDVTTLAKGGATKEDIHEYLKQRGVNVSIPTCGQFMSVVVAEHGGKIPENFMTASSWNLYGKAGYDPDPNAINVAVKQGTPIGQGGSHVTVPIPQYDPAGNVTGYLGRGVNQEASGKERAIISSHPITIGTGKGQYQIRSEVPDVGAHDMAFAGPPEMTGGSPQMMAGADRAAFDQLLAGDIHKVSADGEMEVNHDNAPDGVSIKAEGPLFNKVVHNRRSAGPSQGNLYPSADDGSGTSQPSFSFPADWESRTRDYAGYASGRGQVIR